jgi:F-type H+-transporting ATPase subunit b
MDAIIPKVPEVFISGAAFLVLFVFVWKFALPPIVRMLDERADKIRESIEKAEETRIEAERLLEDYKVQMTEARGDAAKVIEQGRKVAETMKDDIIAKANEEAAGIVAKAREAMESDKNAAMAELQASVADISVSVAGKLIGEKLSADDHAKLIEKYMAEVGSFNDN